MDVLSDLWTEAVVESSFEASVMRVGVGIDALTDVLSLSTSVVVGTSIGMLVGVEIIIVVASAVVAFAFSVSGPSVVDALVGALLEALTTVYAGVEIVIIVSNISVDLFADVDVNLLTAVKNVLKFIGPASLASSVPFC